VAGGVATFASRHNSLTFDEPFMVASGVRALETGDITMTWDQPPVMFYVYGAAVYLYGAAAARSGSGGIRLPAENGTIMLPPEVASEMPPSVDATRPVPRWGVYNRFDYAREFFFRSGNDPERLTLAARIAAIVVIVSLVAVLSVFLWRVAGPIAAALAASMLVFLPDVLAHGSIAYNDAPLALAFFGALWGLDWVVRAPSVERALAAGALTGVALGVKFSALALGPAAIALGIAEALTRRGDKAWMKATLTASAIVVAVAWLTLVIIYRGDLALSMFREGVQDKILHSGTGHGVPALLLGRTSDTGFWYFFPVALALKTPVAFHLLAIIALVGFASGWSWSREILASRLRLLPVGAAVLLVVLMRSSLNIGVRHALPLIPLFVAMIAVGLMRLWARHGPKVRAAVVALIILSAASSLSHYPWFLSYVTDVVPRAARHRVMVDSNVDWGQGLLALRDYMRNEGVEAVQLAYFGSALPEGYGVRYEPLPSWLPLPEQQDSRPPARWVVVSATHLHGFYVPEDIYRPLRDRVPDRVLANSLYVYQLR
jgi:hypothetical protein